jgi:hypothetical protein
MAIVAEMELNTNEPFFVLRASDLSALPALQVYANALVDLYADAGYKESSTALKLVKLVRAFERYKALHPEEMKYPTL